MSRKPGAKCPGPDTQTDLCGTSLNEHVKAFRVLVSVFSVADTRRRRTYCKGTCGHTWHNLPPR
ncbi:DUF5958 family protein [Streptomyces sp. NBC_01016]|uniref:DUF5958 family protein n=1 Tax=Streptomyces sp. NBC_01016 TaxID=2903720 RepID=UPI00225951FF|nr:DUF5958 family protein [Streptomyces sp. NBC_01016]MCX4834386.1 DUF5958 family protein [Streptomyces sp. NBC_01016]